MKVQMARRLLVLMLVCGIFSGVPLAAQPVTDPGWPRVFEKDGKQLIVYQPQVDYWHGYTNLHFRAAVAIKGVTPEGKFGVAEVDAVTVVDHAARIVALVPAQRDIHFANASESEAALLRAAANELRPPGHWQCRLGRFAFQRLRFR